MSATGQIYSYFSRRNFATDFIDPSPETTVPSRTHPTNKSCQNQRFYFQQQYPISKLPNGAFLLDLFFENVRVILPDKAVIILSMPSTFVLLSPQDWVSLVNILLLL